MEKLTVHSADLEAFRSSARSSFARADHFHNVKTQLSKCIREYEVAEYIKPVPLILVDSRKFMMMPSEGAGSAGGALRYQCDFDEPDDSEYDF